MSTNSSVQTHYKYLTTIKSIKDTYGKSYFYTVTIYMDVADDRYIHKCIIPSCHQTLKFDYMCTNPVLSLKPKDASMSVRLKFQTLDQNLLQIMLTAVHSGLAAISLSEI